MRKKKDNVKAGLNGLLAPAQEPTTGTTEQKVKGNYKSVCYSIPTDVAEKIRRIAWYDRRKLGAVVADALEQYIKKWKPITPVDPNDLFK